MDYYSQGVQRAYHEQKLPIFDRFGVKEFRHSRKKKTDEKSGVPRYRSPRLFAISRVCVLKSLLSTSA